MAAQQKRRRIVTYTHFGWEQVADAFCVSVSTVKRWAARDDDPLPVETLNGQIRAHRGELEAWWQRNRKRADDM